MHTYALIVGIVSLVVGLLLWFLQAKKPETLMKVLFNLPKVGDVTVESLTAFFLFAWWCVGAGILTFQGPFTQTTNGYFATWAGLVSSTLIAGACMPVVADAKEKAPATSSQDVRASSQDVRSGGAAGPLSGEGTQRAGLAVFPNVPYEEAKHRGD